MRTSVPGAVLGGVLVALLAGACGAPPPVPDSATQAAFREVAVQPAELGDAEAVALQRCLRDRGFPVPLPRALNGSAPNLPAALGQVDRDGYGGAVDRSGGDDVVDRFARALSPSDRERFAAAVADPSVATVRYATPRGWEVTAPTGGCVATARTEVYGSVQAWLATTALPQDLNAEAATVYADPRTARAQDAYRSCMAGHGWPVEFPQDAVALAQRSVVPGEPGPGPVERELARTDAGCRTQSELLPVYLDVLADLGAEWIARNAEAVRDAGAVVVDSTVRARAILADRGNA